MSIKFTPLGITEEKLNELLKLGLKYDKRQKKQMLKASQATKPTVSDIQRFEAETGLVLPDDYRQFLLETNGGIPNKSHIIVPGCRERIVQSLFALTNPAEIYTIRHFIEVYKGRIPSGMLPFANDPGGNLFLIGANPERDLGNIYFWDHEQEADSETQPYYGNIYLIVESFSNFITTLTE